MATRSILSAMTALALIASPALADITPAEVWAEWQDFAARYGMTTETEGEEETGGDLVVKGVVYSSESAASGTVSMEIGDITFRDLGDGSVGVELAETMPITLVTPEMGEGEGSAEIMMSLVQSGFRLTVSGDAMDRIYDYEADTLGINDLRIDEPSGEDFEFSLEFMLQAVSGQTTMSGDDAIDYEAQVAADAITFAANGSGTDEMGQPAEFDLRGEATAFVQTSTGTFTTMEADDTPAEMISKGFRAQSNSTYDAMAYELTGEGVDGPFRFVGTGVDVEGSVAMDENGVRYATRGGAQTVTVEGNAPFPVTTNIAETAASLTLPVVPGDEPQEFALALRIVGVALDEMIWSMIDPAGQFPRDPASIVVDLSGEVIVTDDFLAPDFAENAEGAPGTIENVAINELRLEFGGAQLTGTGDFDFIQTEMMPMPVGQADLILKGGNALLDTLATMGVLPPEQAMGARMFLGLFAVPGEGEDELTTTIEMREDGGPYVNGQRLPFP